MQPACFDGPGFIDAKNRSCDEVKEDGDCFRSDAVGREGSIYEGTTAKKVCCVCDGGSKNCKDTDKWKATAVEQNIGQTQVDTKGTTSATCADIDTYCNRDGSTKEAFFASSWFYHTFPRTPNLRPRAIGEPPTYHEDSKMDKSGTHFYNILTGETMFEACCKCGGLLNKIVHATCYDGIWNGDERGVDYGGSCMDRLDCPAK